MYADNIFRMCLIVSVFLHLGLIFPWPFLHFLSRDDEVFQKIEMTYFSESKIGGIKEENILPQRPQKSAPDIVTKSNTDNSDNKAADISKTIKTDPQKEEIKIPKEAGAESSIQIKNNLPEEVGEVVNIGIRKGVVYEKYNLSVRSKIQSVVEKNKRGIPKETEIYVRFVLDRSGALKDLYIYKSNDSGTCNLERLVLKSIKEAAPFSPFDDRIKENELKFIVPVRFVLKD